MVIDWIRTRSEPAHSLGVGALFADPSVPPVIPLADGMVELADLELARDPPTPFVPPLLAGVELRKLDVRWLVPPIGEIRLVLVEVPPIGADGVLLEVPPVAPGRNSGTIPTCSDDNDVRLPQANTASMPNPIDAQLPSLIVRGRNIAGSPRSFSLGLHRRGSARDCAGQARTHSLLAPFGSLA